MRKPRKRITWEITDTPRGAPKEVRQFIAKLSLLNNEEMMARLDRLLQQIDSSAATSDPDPSNLAQLAQRCQSSEANIAEHSFHHMKSLLMFTLCLEQYVLSLKMIYSDSTFSQS